MLRVCQIALSSQQKAAASAAGVCDGFHGLGTDTLHHCLDQRTGREVLPGAAFDVLRVFLQQAFVDLALDIGGHGNPVFPVDHLDDAVQDGGVVDLVGGAFENFAQRAALLAQGFQDGFVLFFQLGAL